MPRGLVFSTFSPRPKAGLPFLTSFRLLEYRKRKDRDPPKLDPCDEFERTAKIDQKTLSLRNLISISVQSIRLDNGEKFGLSSSVVKQANDLAPSCMMRRARTGRAFGLPVAFSNRGHDKCRQQAPSLTSRDFSRNLRWAYVCSGDNIADMSLGQHATGGLDGQQCD